MNLLKKRRKTYKNRSLMVYKEIYVSYGMAQYLPHISTILHAEVNSIMKFAFDMFNNINLSQIA